MHIGIDISLANQVVGGGQGGSFSPKTVAGLQAWALSSAPYYYAGGPVGGFQVLDSKQTIGTYRAPRQGRAYLFDGVNDEANAGNVLSQTGSFTISINFRCTNTTAIYQNLLAKGTTGRNYVAAIAPSGLSSVFIPIAGVSGLTGIVSIAPATIVVNTWHSLIITYNNTTKAQLVYFDGVLRATVAGVSGNPTTNVEDFVLGAGTGGFSYFTGNMRDVRVYNVVKDATAVANIFAGGQDTVGLGAQYLCNEEAGTTGYDISGNSRHLTLNNITAATFHAANTGVTQNLNNKDGYRLSGGAYIPKRLSDSLAADGNALTVTGQCPYPMAIETPCITGNGTDVYADLGSAVIPATADFSLSIDYYHQTNDTTTRAIIGQATGAAFLITANQNPSGAVSAGGLSFYGNPIFIGAASGLVAGSWHTITLSRVGSLFTLIATLPDGTVVVSASGSQALTIPTVNTSLLRWGNSGDQRYNNGRVASFSLTTGGVTTYFPLQGGPGSGNTNRDLVFIRSNGTYGVVAGGLVGGTVAGIWANRTLGGTQDWCVNYGGRINASGVFIPATLDSSICADGQALNCARGKFDNPSSRLNANPFTAAEYNGRSIPTAYAQGGSWNATITPTNTGFRRTRADGDDRFLIYQNTLSGADLTKVQAYTA